MNRPLHTDPQHNITASEGWQDMRMLLDKHLPVTPAPERRKPFFYYLSAASFMLLLLLSYLQLQHDPHKAVAEKQLTVKNSAPTKIDPAVFANVKARLQRDALNNIADEQRKKLYNNLYINNNSASINTTAFFPSTDDNTAKEANELFMADKNGTADTKYPGGNINGIAGEGFTALNKLRYHPNPINNIVSPAATVAKNKQPNKGYWQFAAGLGFNAVIDQQLNMQPYPVAEARYNFSPRFYLSAGISAWSPVNSSSKSINKTVFVNDTANNLRSYNQVTNYMRFYYADIPLMAGLNINKKWAVQAGIQASVLIAQKKRYAIDSYDFQMNPAANNPTSLTLTNAGSFGNNARRIDYRLTGGVRYNINRLSLDLSYQHALQSPVNSSNVKNEKNRVVSLKLLYLIK